LIAVGAERRAETNNEAVELLALQSTVVKRDQDRLGREVTALAYPYGWPGTYTPSTKLLAAEAGYCLAFTSRAGVNWPSTLDLYEVSRLGVGSGDSQPLLRARTALHAAFGASFL